MKLCKENAEVQSLAAEYQAILAYVLQPAGYEIQEQYEDAFGGLVLDSFRGCDRVTCIVSESSVQLLFLKDGTVESRLFNQGALDKLEFSSFLDQNIK